MGIVELLELAQGVQQVPLVPDQGTVEQFAAAGLHPAFHDRIHSRHLYPAEHDLDPGVVEDGVKQAGELAVAVPDQEPRPAADVLESTYVRNTSTVTSASAFRNRRPQ